MVSLNISQILTGTPGISPIEGANLVENCIVALHRNNHLNPVMLHLIDFEQDAVPLYWEDRYDGQLERTYADLQSVTERSDYTKLPAYISVVEFGTPKAKFGRKEMEV